MNSPPPATAMTENTQRAYSTATFTLASAYVKSERKKFEQRFGNMMTENYQVKVNITEESLRGHYDDYFKQSDWQTLDLSPAQGQWGFGWQNGKHLFAVIGVAPSDQDSYRPVYVVTNLPNG